MRDLFPGDRVIYKIDGRSKTGHVRIVGHGEYLIEADTGEADLVPAGDIEYHLRSIDD